MSSKSKFIRFLFFILIVRTYLAMYGFETIYMTLLINILLCFVLFQSQSKQAAILLTIIGVILSIFNKNTLALMDVLLFSYIMRDENLRSLSKFYLRILVVLVLMIVSLNYCGIITSGETFINYKGNNGIVYAGDLGMQNPNSAGQLFFMLSAVFCIVYNDLPKFKKRLILCLILFYINYLAYNYTYCRTAFIGSCILLIVYLLHPIIKRFTRINKVAFSLFPFLTSMVAFYITLHYYDYLYLDEILTHRFSEPGKLIANMGLIQWLVGTPSPGGVDTSYMIIFFSGGIVVFIYLFYKIMTSIWMNYKLILELEPVIVAMLFYGITENIFSSCNPLSVLFYSFLFFPRPINRYINYRILIKH